MEKPDKEKNEKIKHIVRNGTMVIKGLVNRQWRILDQILGRCKDMEEELDKVNKKDDDDSR